MARSFAGYIAPTIALIGTAIFCSSVMPSSPVTTTETVAHAAAIAPTPSATLIQTPTPNALATTQASSAATNQAASDGLKDTQSANSTNTAIAETQTPRAWTQSAIDMQQRIDQAGADEAEANAFMAWQTVTMLPTSLTETEAAKWATIAAEQTAVEDRRVAQGRAKHYGEMANEAWGVLQVAVPVSLIVALAASALVLPNALSWRVQGTNGGQAQATVEGAKGRAPIPTTTAGAPSEPLDPHTKTERLALRVLGRMAGISGADSPTLTSASDFGDNRSRDRVVAALVAAGYAVSENGVGVRLLHQYTIGDLIDDIASGGIQLPDPPTPMEEG